MTPHIFSLEGKTAVVIGGSSGIGRPLSLADAGADVIASAARGEELLMRTPMGRSAGPKNWSELPCSTAPTPRPSLPGRLWSSTEEFWPAASINSRWEKLRFKMMEHCGRESSGWQE
jgi:hypothetical protein